MTAKEKVLKAARDWTEEQAAAALRAAESKSASIVVKDKRPADANTGVDETSQLPAEPEPLVLPIPKSWGWGRLPSGRPAPNWVAGLDAVRSGR
jgi:hypothetical protein